MKDFKNITEVREYYGISQKELSQKTGIPVNTLSGWETGVRTPSPYMTGLIAKSLEYEKIRDFLNHMWNTDTETIHERKGNTRRTHMTHLTFTEKDFKFRDELKDMLPEPAKAVDHELRDYNFIPMLDENMIHFQASLTKEGSDKFLPRIKKTKKEEKAKDCTVESLYITIMLNGSELQLYKNEVSLAVNMFYGYDDFEIADKTVILNDKEWENLFTVLTDHYGGSEKFFITAYEQILLTKKRRNRDKKETER